MSPLQGFACRRTRRHANGSVSHFTMRMPAQAITYSPLFFLPVSDIDFQRCLKALLAGLQDYTTDPRGDVGAMVRVACMSGLATLSTAMKELKVDQAVKRFPVDLYQKAVRGVLKQSVEKFATVRGPARKALQELVASTSGRQYDLEGREVLEAMVTRYIYFLITFSNGVLLFMHCVCIAPVTSSIRIRRLSRMSFRQSNRSPCENAFLMD